MGEKDRGERKGPGFKKTAILSASLAICPGDDIALIASQINTTIHPDMPVAAMIQQEPKIEVVFDIKNLKV